MTNIVTVLTDRPIAAPSPFDSLRASRVALLTTFRRTGVGVATPVEIHVVDGNAYFFTWSTSGKIKRLASNPHVLLAPCTVRGTVIGPTVDGVARRLDGSDGERAWSNVGGRWYRWLWQAFYKLRYHAELVLYEVVPLSHTQHGHTSRE